MKENEKSSSDVSSALKLSAMIVDFVYFGQFDIELVTNLLD